jgi:quinol monooxygenase YgiN
VKFFTAVLTDISSKTSSLRLLARFLRCKVDEFPDPSSFQAATEGNWAMIVFSMQIGAADESRTTLLRILGSMLGPTRVAPGCLDARLYSNLDKRKTLLLVEEWESRQQFERNLDADKINAIVAAIELSSGAPVVRVDTAEREEGVDALALHCSVAVRAARGMPCLPSCVL